MRAFTTAILTLVIASVAFAQQSVIRAHNGLVRQQIRSDVAGGFDVNADGHADYVICGLGTDAITPAQATTTLYCGASGAVLWQNTEAPTDDYGRSVASAGLIDGDGIKDVIVGSPLYDDFNNGPDSGRFIVYSGSTGLSIMSITGLQGDELGYSVDGGGDVDGDGEHDVIAGAPGDNSDTGRVFVYSGDGNNGQLHSIPGDNPGDRFGSSVAMLGDTNNDGFDDFMVGAINYARVYSGLNGSLLHTLGYAGTDYVRVSDTGDVDGDNLCDFMVGLPDFNALQVWAASGSGLIHQKFGATGLGHSVSSVGDVDADGVPDFAAGAASSNQVPVYSGSSGALIFVADDIGINSGGIRVSGAGDVNNDGFDDVIFGGGRICTCVPSGGGRVRISGVEKPYPGTGEDFVLTTGVNGPPGKVMVKTAAAGDTLTMVLDSPLGTFTFRPFVIGQLFTTGSPPPSPFPGLHIGPTFVPAPFFILDGGPPFGSIVLPSGGITMGPFAIPSGLGGVSLIAQGVISDSSANNAIFASTDGHEIRF